MATRNLTPKFKEIREKSHREIELDELDKLDKLDKLEKGKLFSGPNSSGSGSGSNSSDELLKVQKNDNFEGIINKIDDNINKISFKVEYLNKLQKTRLKVNFNTNEHEQDIVINTIVDEIKVMFDKSRTQIQNLNKNDIIQKNKQVADNIIKSKLLKLQKELEKFRKNQSNYLQSLSKQNNSTHSSTFDFLDEQKPSSSSKKNNYANNELTMEQVNEMAQLEAQVNSRDEEIVKIAKSVQELAQLFNELGALIITQGTVLDRIDYNMTEAVEHIDNATQELDKAEKHQEGGTAFKCVLFLIFIVIVLVMAIVIKVLLENRH
jgi:syntaxin 16